VTRFMHLTCFMFCDCFNLCCAVSHRSHLMDFGHDSFRVIEPCDSSYESPGLGLLAGRVYIRRRLSHSSYHEPSPLHLRQLKSRHQGNHRGIPPPPPLLPLDGLCLGERCYNPSSPSGVYPLLHGVLVPVHR